MVNSVNNNFSLCNIVNEKKEDILEVAEKIKEYSQVDLKLNIKKVKKFYSSTHNWVFKIDKIPSIIFKIPANSEQNIRHFKKRCHNIELGQALCKEFNLNLLNIPEIHKIDENLLAERKLKFIKNPHDLYKIYSKETVLEATQQFTIFICKSGLFDTTRTNYEFLVNGSGIGLYDLECMAPEYPEYGLQTFITGLPDKEFFENVKEVIKVHNSKAYEKLF